MYNDTWGLLQGRHPQRLPGFGYVWEAVELDRLMTLEMAVSGIESGRGKTRMRVSWEYLCKLYDWRLQDKEFQKIIFMILENYYVQAYQFSKHTFLTSP